MAHVGRFGGPFVRCWAKGPGAGGGARPWVEKGHGPHEQFQFWFFFFFQKLFEYVFDVFD